MSSQKKKINVAVIGTGGRGTGVISNLLKDSNRGVKIVSCYNKVRERAENALIQWEEPDAVICDSYQEAIQRDDVDWVMVFSPNAYHKEHIVCGFEAGKNVFTEKPLATKIEDCAAINAAHKKSGKLFATGFVLRYAPIYRKVKELITNGTIGRVLSIDANENVTPAHGSYIMQNWRRLKSESGPHILEKCCHDLDLLNWFCDSIPSKVASFGGRDLFTPANSGMYDKFKKDGTSVFSGWPDPEGLDTPFHDDTDMMDNQVGIFQYRNGIRVMFQCTMSNAIPERRMYISGTEGNIVVELYALSLEYKRIGEDEMKVVNFAGDGHGGGDSFIMKELYEESMVKGKLPACSGNEGLNSAVLALALDRSVIENKMIDLEPVWQELGK
jgi:predicted dehydrogenase